MITVKGYLIDKILHKRLRISVLTCRLWVQCSESVSGIGVARGGPGGHAHSKFLAYVVILCFERRYPKQNSVICLISNILSPKFCAGYATDVRSYRVTQKDAYPYFVR